MLFKIIQIRFYRYLFELCLIISVAKCPYFICSFNRNFCLMSPLIFRPALDSFDAVWDRMKVAWWRWRYAPTLEQSVGSETSGH